MSAGHDNLGARRRNGETRTGEVRVAMARAEDAAYFALTRRSMRRFLALQSSVSLASQTGNSGP
jgi:hypothetical protein